MRFITEEYGKGVLLFCDSCGILFKDRCSRDACCYFLNMQGDVIALLDSSGNLEAEYTYDAWSKSRFQNNGSKCRKIPFWLTLVWCVPK